MNRVTQSSEVAQAKSVLAQQHAVNKLQRDRQSQTDELEYDEPRCNWTPGGDNNECGDGLICPPCS